MDKIEALESYAKQVCGDKVYMMDGDDFDKLIQSAANQTERDFYVCVYNFLLKQSAKEAIRNGVY